MKTRHIMVVVLLCILAFCGCAVHAEHAQLQEEEHIEESAADGAVGFSGESPNMLLTLTTISQKDQIMEHFLEVLAADDKDALTEMFCDNVVSQDGFHEQVVALLEFFNGSVLSCEFCDATENLEVDKEHTVLDASYDVETTSNKYRIAFRYCLRNDADSGAIGMQSVYIILEENADPEFSYGGGGVWRPGIVIETGPVPKLIESGKYAGTPMFDLEDYAEDIALCFVDENVGSIDSPEAATEKAKQVWIDYMSYDSYEGKELRVYYDPDEDCWFATLKILPREDPISPEGPWPVLDCEPCVIFRSDGQIIGLWTQ